MYPQRPLLLIRCMFWMLAPKRSHIRTPPQPQWHVTRKAFFLCHKRIAYRWCCRMVIVSDKRWCVFSLQMCLYFFFYCEKLEKTTACPFWRRGSMSDKILNKLKKKRKVSSWFNDNERVDCRAAAGERGVWHSGDWWARLLLNAEFDDKIRIISCLMCYTLKQQLVAT